MIGLVIALGVFAAPQPGQNYPQCLLSVARALEPSGETAEAIAQSADTACAVLEQSPNPGNAAVTEVVNELRESFRHLLALQIVRERACSRTPKCILSTLPEPFKSEVP